MYFLLIVLKAKKPKMRAWLSGGHFFGFSPLEGKERVNIILTMIFHP